MTDSTERPVRAWLLTATFAALTYFAVFRLPLHFPPTRRLVSASYLFGFNNTVAILALAGLLGAAALYMRLRRVEGRSSLVRFPQDQEPGAPGTPAWWLAAMAALYAVLTGAAAWYAQQATVAALAWESRHFLHRIKLLEIYGLRPYVDFQAEYGPALMYPPVYLHRLLEPLGVTREWAYFGCHWLMNVAGVACLYYLLRHAAAPRWAKGVSFLLVGVAGFAPYLGLNGVVLRFACPYASLLLGHRMFLRLAVAPPWLRWPASFAGVAALLLVNVLISPEIALAFALAWLAYAGLAIRQDWRLLAVSVTAILVTALGCRFALPDAYSNSLLRFSQGANNLPLLPAAHIVLYVVTLVLLVPPLLAAGLRGGTREAPLLGGFGALTVVMSPGALGRCDPPHVLFYGLCASLLLMTGLANKSRRALAAYALAYAFVSIGMMQAVNLVVFFGVRPRHLLEPVRGVREVVADVLSDLAPRDLSYLSALDKYARVGLPFATNGGDNAAEAYLFERRKVAPEFYTGAVGVYTESEIARKLHDVFRHEYLLVKDGWERAWPRDPCAAHRNDLWKWFLYPAGLECKRPDLDSYGDLNRFIAANYRPIERVGPSVVLQRIADASRARLSPPASADPPGPAGALR
jgi:hypothetical protein